MGSRLVLDECFSIFTEDAWIHHGVFVKDHQMLFTAGLYKDVFHSGSPQRIWRLFGYRIVRSDERSKAAVAGVHPGTGGGSGGA